MRLFIILEGMEMERKKYLMMDMNYTTTTAFGKNCMNCHRPRDISPGMARVIGYIPLVTINNQSGAPCEGSSGIESTSAFNVTTVPLEGFETVGYQTYTWLTSTKIEGRITSSQVWSS